MRLKRSSRPNDKRFFRIIRQWSVVWLQEDEFASRTSSLNDEGNDVKVPLEHRTGRRCIKTITMALALLLVSGCRQKTLQPSISIERVPAADRGGPDRTVTIAGRAVGARPGERVVVYAKEDAWWVQPFWSRPFTSVQHDSTWVSDTHLGTEYAALLVGPDYHPFKNSRALPVGGDGVIAATIVQGSSTPATPLRSLRFSGYDWTVRNGAEDRGGDVSTFDPRNAWVDGRGFLHLRMGETDGRWLCAEVKLTRSLGYGTYSFTVQDSAQLSPSAVLGMFTVDEQHGEEPRAELDIELSRWGKAEGHNAMYVVQPYYVPGNVHRFSVRAGTQKHTLRWGPMFASFESVEEPSPKSKAGKITEHTFTSGTPAPANESVHINFYDFLHSRNKMQGSAEVVIEKFEFLP